MQGIACPVGDKIKVDLWLGAGTNQKMFTQLYISLLK